VQRTTPTEVKGALLRVAKKAPHQLRPKMDPGTSKLPIIQQDEISNRFKGQPVIVVDGYLIDVRKYVNQHPGGRALLQAGF